MRHTTRFWPETKKSEQTDAPNSHAFGTFGRSSGTFGRKMMILPSPPSRGFWVAIILVLFAVCLFLSWPLLPIGGPFGYWDAQKDIRNGKLMIKTPEFKMAWWINWRDSLKKTYNIEIGGRVRSSFASGFLTSYDHAYNSVQTQEIVRRFGKDVVEEQRNKYFSTRKLQ